jgi:hypothetical protein
VLVLGVIAPVTGLIVNPLLLAEKVPPVYAPVPVRVTGWSAVCDLQKEGLA